MDEDLSKELELQIKGAEKPSIWELLGIRFILLPYTIGKVRFCASKSSNSVICMVIWIFSFDVFIILLSGPLFL